MVDISDGIQFRRDGVDPSEWPKLTCSQANQLDCTGNLYVEGDVQIEGKSLASVIQQLTEKLEAVQRELQQKTTQIDRLNGEFEATKRTLQNTRTELENTKNNLMQSTKAAQETANTALSQAQAAQNTANSGNSAAATAQNTANTALSKANNLEGRTGDIESRIRHISVNPGNGNTHINAGNKFLAIQQDGNIVVYENSGGAVWDTGTWR